MQVWELFMLISMRMIRRKSELTFYLADGEIVGMKILLSVMPVLLV